MVAVHPVRAFLVSQAWAADVVGPAYDALRPGDRLRLASENPDSFYNVIRSPLDYGDRPVPEDLLATNRAALDRLLRTGRFRPPGELPAVHLYRLASVDHAQTAVVADLDLADLDTGVVRAHERTRVSKEDELVRQLGPLGVNASPVGIAYRADPVVDALVAEGRSGPSDLDFRTDDGTRHTVWTIDEPALVMRVVRAFERVEPTYIVDGHHRVAAAARLGHTALLVGLVPHDQLTLLPYHRLVRGPLTGVEEALAAAGADPLDEPRPPMEPAEVTLCLDGNWYRLALHLDVDGPGSIATTAVQEQVLGPICGIDDARSDPRLDFVAGSGGIAHLARLSAATNGLAIAVHPPTIDQLFAEADAGRTMPPKSTWFEPKFRSGVFVVAR